MEIDLTSEFIQGLKAAGVSILPNMSGRRCSFDCNESGRRARNYLVEQIVQVVKTFHSSDVRASFETNEHGIIVARVWCDVAL